MKGKPLRVTLVQHPTVALRMTGFEHPDFDMFADNGAYMGNIHRKLMPPSLPRVAALLEDELGADVRVVDLRIAGGDREEVYKEVDWEGYKIEARRVGARFEMLDEHLEDTDWVGLSSHFTFESGVVKDLIQYIKAKHPKVKVMVGGADVRVRAPEYVGFGADLAFPDDINTAALADARWGAKVTSSYHHPFGELIRPAFHRFPRFHDYTGSHDGPVPQGVGSPVGFLYFTRGCPRECDFCESRKTGFEVLDMDSTVAMLKHFHDSGVRTLNFSDDNLLLMAAKPAWRQQLIDSMNLMREMRFAWEFPHGLEVGMLIRKGILDEELMEALFAHEIDPDSGELIGGYRFYVPVETFTERDRYRKLREVDDQNVVIRWLAESGFPELNFGVVLPPNCDEETFEATRVGYSEVKDIVRAGGTMKARYSAFHLIPIATYRDMETKYSVKDFPEGWNFWFPIYDGTNFSARELFERRLRLVKEIDPANFESMTRGQYTYA